VHAYDQTLALGEDAWDIYLLYGPMPAGTATSRRRRCTGQISPLPPHEELDAPHSPSKHATSFHSVFTTRDVA
jgi:hypothetical protein